MPAEIDWPSVLFLGRFVVLMGRRLLSQGFLMASVLWVLFLRLRMRVSFAVVCVCAEVSPCVE